MTADDATAAMSNVQIDDGTFRVTEWTIGPGQSIPEHEHLFDYVVIPLVDDTMHVVGADGKSSPTTLRVGESYSRPAGAVHSVWNHGSRTIVFVEVERLR